MKIKTNKRRKKGKGSATRNFLITNAKRTLRHDPTRTGTLRKLLIHELRKRFAKLKLAVVDLLLKEDALGLKERKPLALNAFCATGESGGVDPSCSPGGGGKEPSSPEDDYARNGTKAKAFKEWFSDSKVVDERGEPKILYHGTREDFDQFDKAKAERWGAEAGSGFYLTESKEMGDHFARGKKTLEIYAAVKNPLDFDATLQSEQVASVRKIFQKYGESYAERFDKSLATFREYENSNQSSVTGYGLWKTVADVVGDKDVNKVFVKAGYDGIVHTTADISGTVKHPPSWPRYEGNPDGNFGKAWVVFEPNRIKAVKNRGTFNPNDPVITNFFTLNQRWAFRTSPEKVAEFQKWLRTQIDRDILLGTESDVWEAYVRQGYIKGAGRSYQDFVQRRLELRDTLEDTIGFRAGTERGFLQATVSRPESVEKVRLLAGRAYDDLEGVTAEMSTRMVRHLTDGLVQGKGPREIARELADDVDGIGLGRATTIARTELTRVHAEGQLDALEAMGVEEIGVMVEWKTAEDEGVCPLCEPLEGVVLTIEEARGMLPRHPS